MKSIIYIILDRSGSMSGKEKDVIGGVNTFISEQKKLPDPASIAFVRFDTDIERFRPMQALEKIEPLTDSEYTPRGSTALLDAVGQTINEAEKDWVIEKPERAIMVIVTDGHENASVEFKKDKIKELIQAREKSGLWAFIYLGANVDAFEEASSLGINLANTAGYRNTSKGIGATYAKMSETVGTMRASGATAAVNLGGNINEDGTLSKNTGKTALGASQTDSAAVIKAKIDAAKALADAARASMDAAAARAARDNQAAMDAKNDANRPAWTPPDAAQAQDQPEVLVVDPKNVLGKAPKAWKAPF